jgi:hypothetical protein
MKHANRELMHERISDGHGRALDLVRMTSGQGLEK